ncbi:MULTISPECIES: DUF2187 family protein [Bacillus]|uniref:DUF2187 domain-containing protein n=3 Tax=Bacillus cereus group TaxID=86661 RepID=A0A9W5KQJ2_BACCE|nr:MULTISPECIES: DUF2187 family protein [Bacillus cereus group]EKS8366751.1 DUF2187 family protein [Bacillus cereus]AHA75718.1 hypothetical protein YBT1518_31180 [Bacillus thuringiensis YBT-1518]EJR59608.1 hypothetical protein IK5_06245 [Bacillus cereus VD154]EKS8373286.1 DUF2187 family protein [Bacillus cereus]KIU76527.1 hypothetical protein C797_04319 [Bacillus thuringiensis Sbt003]
MASNTIATNIKTGDYVTFPYRHNPSLQLTGYIVTVLEHTSIVDISAMESFFQLGIDGRQVVRHEQYKPVPSKSDEKVAQ